MIYVIRKSGYEFNDYSFTYQSEGGVAAWYEAAMDHMAGYLEDYSFNLCGPPEELSDMPGILRQFIEKHPRIFEKDEAWEHKLIVRIDRHYPYINYVVKQLFQLLKEPPVHIKRADIDDPALWNKE